MSLVILLASCAISLTIAFRTSIFHIYNHQFHRTAYGEAKSLD